MKPLLFAIAALLLFFIGIVHSYLGERHLFRRLFALPNLPLLRSDRPFTERVIRYAWHLTSLAWWGIAALLLVFAFPPVSIRLLQWVCGGISVLTGLVILVTVGKRHPAWLLFLLAGALSWLAAS
jgi:hypothetical protein